MTSSLIHPTAVIAAEAQLAADVRVGPFVVIEGPVVLGPGCVVRPHVHLMGRVVVGSHNDFGTGCVIGDRPQHTGYKGEETSVRIGHHNTFREGVSVHRGMPNGRQETVIGDRNLFMVNSHVGHDCVVGNDVILVNGSLLGGHVTIGDRALISGNAGIHQFCRIGRLAMLRGLSVWSTDLPPFFLGHNINNVSGVNVVGMKRAGMGTKEIQAVRSAFRLLYLNGLLIRDATDRIEKEIGEFPAIQELVAFIRTTKRGIPGPTRLRCGSAEEPTEPGRAAA
jgi:UDP-N-acetylglucosamine acyltransferase